MILGNITGKVTTTNFQFKVEGDAKKFEYVQVMHQHFGFVLAQITEIIKDSEKTIAHCIIIGYRDEENKLKNLNYPFEPGTEVLIAEDQLITKILGLEGKQNNAYVGILEGRENLKVYLDLNKLLTKHVNVLSKSGSGKSYNVGVLLEELLERKVPIVILDPHGEYSTLTLPNPKDKERMQLFGIEPKAYLENIQEFGLENAKPLKLNSKNLTSGELIKLLPARISTTQQGILYSALKNQGGRIDFNDLIYELETAEDNAAKYTLINILEYLKNLKLFSENPTLPGELVKPNSASIINLKGVAPEIQEIIAYKIVNDLFTERKKGNIPPFFLVVEEAHNFVPERNFGEAKSSAILRQVASEGRKFGLGLCIISQRPSRVDKSVLSQASTQIILKVTNPNDIRAISNSVEGITSETEKEIQNLPIGTALVTGVVDTPLFVEIRPRRTKHGGEAINVFAQEEVEEPEPGDVIPAITPKYSEEDYKLMHNKDPQTQLVPAVLLTCEQHSETFTLLIELIKLTIITNVEEFKGKSLLDLNLQSVSSQQQRILDLAIKLNSFKPADLFSKSGLQFAELLDGLKNLEARGYIKRDGSDFLLSDQLSFLANLNKERTYESINYIRSQAIKLEPKFPIETIKEFLSKFTDIKDIKECSILTYV